MLPTLLVVLPVFALILAGWLARRCGVLGPHATTELNRFVVYLALPALLFDILAHARWAEIWQPGFIAAFGLSSLAVFALTVGVRVRRAGLADAAIDGLNAGYPNTGYMGLPVALAALGPAALAPTTVAAILTVCGVFAVAIVAIEIGLRPSARPAALAAKVARSLLRNPLLVAPVLGGLTAASGLALPGPVESVLKMLGGAASPCALVALGLFLAQPAPAPAAGMRGVGLLVALKLLGHPLLAWILASALGLPPLLAHTAVLMAALPTGTGPFMLAEFYRREAAATARVVLISTVLAVFTVSGYLALIG